MPTKGQPVTVGLIQAKAHSNPSDNLALTLNKAEQAAKDGAQIICTQELFSTEYFCQSEDHLCFNLAETIPGPTTEAFQQLAKRYRVCLLYTSPSPRDS